MAQDNTPPSSQLSRCGQPLPLPANFDCVAYTQIPPSIPPLPNMTLREKNKANTAFEKRNEESVAMTRSFERARASSAGVGSVDVGPPLVALYEYSDSDIELMASSKELVDAVGPLPISVTLKLAEIRLKIVKDTSEKSRREKEKSPVSTIGTLVMQNPVEYSSVLSEDVHIPNIFLETVNQKLWLPLHWWMDAILRDADRDPQSVPSTTCTPSQTSPTTKPVKVQVIDFEKMITKHGGLDYGTTLTPSKWRQCARNLLKAVTQLCSSDPTAITPATELSKHLKFFTLNKWFDDEFHVWYPLEYELRGKVLHNTLYNETAWANELNIRISTHKAAVAAAEAQHQTSPLDPPSARNPKRSADSDGNPAPSKKRTNRDSYSANGQYDRTGSPRAHVHDLYRFTLSTPPP